MNIEAARRACAEAVRALEGAGIATDGLAELVPESRVLGVFQRAARMRPLGQVWRLGTLLLATDGSLFAAGRTTRAAERGRFGYQSLSREARKDIAAAALKGGYETGATVNFDAVPLTMDAGALEQLDDHFPLGVAGGELRVRWRAGASLDGAPTLERYLAERVELLVHPPFSAEP